MARPRLQSNFFNGLINVELQRVFVSPGIYGSRTQCAINCYFIYIYVFIYFFRIYLQIRAASNAISSAPADFHGRDRLVAVAGSTRRPGASVAFCDSSRRRCAAPDMAAQACSQSAAVVVGRPRKAPELNATNHTGARSYNVATRSCDGMHLAARGRCEFAIGLIIPGAAGFRGVGWSWGRW